MIEKIQQLLENDQIELILNDSNISKAIDEDLRLHLTSRIFHINKLNNYGAISLEDYLLERSKIRVSLINSLKNEQVEKIVDVSKKDGVQQIHHGSGDNIIGNKIIKNATKAQRKWR